MPPPRGQGEQFVALKTKCNLLEPASGGKQIGNQKFGSYQFEKQLC
jgi:hypothetical protein